MSETEIEYPKDTIERFQQISQSTGLPIATLKAEYDEMFLDDFIQNDPQFTDEEGRHYTVTMWLWSRYKARQPAEDKSFTSAGLGRVNKTRAGKKQGDAYGIFVVNRKPILKRIVIQEGVIEERKKMLLPTKNSVFIYNSKLGQFRDGGDFIFDDRSNFQDPKRMEVSIFEMLKKIGIPRIDKLRDTVKYPSQRDGKGWVTRTDWRIIRGVIVSSTTFTNDDGTEGGNYRITDTSLGANEEVSEEGQIQRNTITVWVAPELMTYANRSICDFAGTINVKQDGEAQMNAYLIIPKVMIPVSN